MFYENAAENAETKPGWPPMELSQGYYNSGPVLPVPAGR